MGTRILLIALDALGTVLATTAQLPAIKRSYPDCHITWITRSNAAPLLLNNPFIDRLVEWNDENRMMLQQQKFELALNGDKSRPAAAFMNSVSAEVKRGFGLNENGAIIPLNAATEYSFRMGLDDQLKFHVNRRTGNDILAEAWELDYRRDEYVLQLTDTELAACERWRSELDLADAGLIIGFNTGCSTLFPLKKLEIETQAQAILDLADELPEARFILLGGREDTDRNRQIVERTGGIAIPTPTTLGLREGIVLENLADIVVSGDSLGMHIAIALKKHVVAWFGLSCAAEIDLYDRGTKLVRQLECAPCWKKSCDMPYGPICVTEFKAEWIVQAVTDVVDRLERNVGGKTSVV